MLKEKLLLEQRHAQQEIQRLNQESERLTQKNENAKAKVEAIIQRLAIWEQPRIKMHRKFSNWPILLK